MIIGVPLDFLIWIGCSEVLLKSRGKAGDHIGCGNASRCIENFLQHLTHESERSRIVWPTVGKLKLAIDQAGDTLCVKLHWNPPEIQ